MVLFQILVLNFFLLKMICIVHASCNGDLLASYCQNLVLDSILYTNAYIWSLFDLAVEHWNCWMIVHGGLIPLFNLIACNKYDILRTLCLSICHTSLKWYNSNCVLFASEKAMQWKVLIFITLIIVARPLSCRCENVQLLMWYGYRRSRAFGNWAGSYHLFVKHCQHWAQGCTFTRRACSLLFAVWSPYLTSPMIVQNIRKNILPVTWCFLLLVHTMLKDYMI